MLQVGFRKKLLSKKVAGGLSYAAFTGDRRRVERVVRDVQTVEVSLHGDPQSLGKSVLRLSTIGVHIGVMKSQLGKGAKAWRLETNGTTPNWL
jgi:hypothetical protein